MTGARALADVLAEYHTGLESELELLTRLKQLSDAQQCAGQSREVHHITAIGEERDTLMSALLTIEKKLRPLRQTLASRRDEASTLPGYPDTMSLHRAAESLVQEIAEGDRQTVAELETVEGTRRMAYEMINRGQASLEGYRRVVLPESLPAALFNRRS